MPSHEDEQHRMTALLRLAVLDSEPEAVFDNLVWLGATICDVPTSVISLIDSDRQWFKARHGIDLTETPREQAFCAHAILDDELLYVPDALLDARFSSHPLVLGEPHIRFYAGAPLVGREGVRYGTLCVFDTQPKTLSPTQQETLTRLARQAVAQLESRREHLQAKAKDATIANLLEALPDAVVACDAAGKLRLLNRTAKDWFGECGQDSSPEHRARMVRVLREEGAVELPAERFPMARAMAGERVREQIIVQMGNRPARVMNCNAEPIRSLSGAPAGAVAVLHDITYMRAAADRVAESEARLRITLQSIEDGVVATDADGRITFINPKAMRLLGRDESAALGQALSGIFRMVCETSGEPIADPVGVTLRCGVASPIQSALLLQTAGEPFVVEFRVTPIRGAATDTRGAVLVLRDVSEARKFAHEIRHQATHDALTGLPNRRHLEAVLESRGDGAHNDAILLVNLDQFKIVNDTCGHVAGDRLLKQAAELMRGALRSSDLLARFGGDEFAVLLRDCRIDDALRIADQMRSALEAMRFVWEGKPFSVSASIGVVPAHGSASAAELMSLAGSACQLAKETGRNRIYVHQPGDSNLALRRNELGWVSRIQSALEEDRFVLYAQRIASLSDAPATSRYEVLVRLREATGELVPPMAFIPAAERYGLMQHIDRWVVDRTLGALAACRHAEAPTLSINLSGRTLGDDGFLDFVEACFARHGVPFSNVCFEVTETTAIANLAQAEKFIAWFRDRGCGFSLDDFGSGMSSFGYLKRLHVDYLKIDGAFVRNLVNDRVDEAMVSAIQNVAAVMGLKTVAEFVEDEATMVRLKAIGVDFAQGYGIHRPEPLVGLL